MNTRRRHTANALRWAYASEKAHLGGSGLPRAGGADVLSRAGVHVDGGGAGLADLGRSSSEAITIDAQVQLLGPSMSKLMISVALSSAGVLEEPVSGRIDVQVGPTERMDATEGHWKATCRRATGRGRQSVKPMVQHIDYESPAMRKAALNTYNSWVAGLDHLHAKGVGADETGRGYGVGS